MLAVLLLLLFTFLLALGKELVIELPAVTNWTLVPDLLPKGVQEAQGTVIHDAAGEPFISILGGFDDFPNATQNCYTRRLTRSQAPWISVQMMPLPVTHMAQTSLGDLFCGAGGYLGSYPGRSSTFVFCFKQTTRNWYIFPRLPKRRAGGGLVMYKEANGRYYLIYAGGVDRPYNSWKEHTDYGTTWILDMWNRNARWVDVGSNMPDPRNHMGAVESCGRFFWVGGQHSENEYTGNRNTVSEFLPATNTWSENPPAQLPIPLGHISASVMAYKCGIMVVGGTSSGRTQQSAIWYWKSETNKWYKIGDFPHRVPAPVCGIHKDTLVCGTGGQVAPRKLYMATIRGTFIRVRP